MIRRAHLFIFLLVTFLLFSPFFLKGYIPFPGNFMVAWEEPWKSATAVGDTPTIAHKPVVDDAFRHLYPLRKLASDLMKKGEWPLWNPYNAAGTPLLAIMHPGYLTPFGFFFLFLPAPLAWSLYILMQPIILGLCMFWYATRLRLSTPAALFSALVLLLSGFSVVRMEYGEFLYILSGLPVLLGIVELLRDRFSNRAIFIIPLVVFLLFLSGQPHMIVYVLGVFAVYALVRLPFAQALRVGLSAALGVGMASVQLLPSLELYSLSTIGRNTSQFIFERFLLPFSHLVTVLIPNYFGNQATYNYFGPHDYVETIASVGTIPVLFAILAFGKGKYRGIVTFFAILAGVSVLATLQWFGARLLYLLPIPILSADVPSRIFVLTTFSIAVLAGIGFDRWKEKGSSSLVRRIFIGFIVLLGGISLFTLFAFLYKGPCPSGLIPHCRLVSVRNVFVEVAVFGLFVLLTSVIRHKGKYWIPIVLVVGIGLYNGQKFLPFSPKEMIFPQAEVLTALQTLTGNGRFFGIGRAHIRTNLAAAYDLSSPEYFDPLHVRRYAEIVSFANTGDRQKGVSRSDILVIGDATPSAEAVPRRERFLDLVSVSHLMFRTDELPVSADTQPVWQDTTWYITARPTALPRAYITSAIEVIPDATAQLNRLFDPTFNPHTTILLEESPKEEMTPGVNARILSSVYNEQSVMAHVEASAPAILVLTDTWYPGWRARVDGKEVPIYRANYTFRAIVMPEGTHEVIFSYEPRSLRVGLLISIASLIAWFFVVKYSRGAMVKR